MEGAALKSSLKKNSHRQWQSQPTIYNCPMLRVCIVESGTTQPERLFNLESWRVQVKPEFIIPRQELDISRGRSGVRGLPPRFEHVPFFSAMNNIFTG